MTRLLMLILGAASLGLAACNTVEGAGQDVSNVGEAVTDTADDVEDEM